MKRRLFDWSKFNRDKKISELPDPYSAETSQKLFGHILQRVLH